MSENAGLGGSSGGEKRERVIQVYLNVCARHLFQILHDSLRLPVYGYLCETCINQQRSAASETWVGMISVTNCACSGNLDRYNVY